MATTDIIFYDHCKKNEVDKVLHMIESGVDDFKGGFIGFCKAGNLDMIKYMIKLSGGAVDYDYGLRVASVNGHFEVVVYLLSIGAGDVNGALYHACKGGNLNICKILMNKYGAKIFNKPHIIQIARERGHTEIIKFLIN